MATVRPIPQYTVQPTKSDITCLVRIYDATGNRFRGFRVTDPIDGNITHYIVEKIAPNGAFLAAWEVTPRDGLKIGVNSATMCDMGAGIVVDMWVYNHSASLPRPWYPDSALIADAGFERGTRLQERGGLGLVGNEGEATVEVDYTRIQNMINALATTLPSMAKQAAKDAINELHMHSQSMQDRGVDQWVRDRMYECLVENGLIKP